MELEEALTELEKSKNAAADAVAAAKKAADESAALKTQLAEVSKKLEASAIKPEDFEAMKAQAEAGKKALEELGSIRAKEADAALAAEFPAIKDRAILTGKTLEEKRSQAAALYKAMELKPGEVKKPPVANEWDKANHTQPSEEALRAAEQEKLQTGVKQAIGAGDANATLKAVMAAQPNATKALLDRMTR